ncbi:MAG: hypothetical protein GQ574_23890 [Crocinitomix sp.]|nr:hypothetical protein [Crocinitomix sp.]
MNLSILVSLLLLSPLFSFAQSPVTVSYDQHIELAEQYNRAYRFDESIAELEVAMEIAKQDNNERQLLDVEISLAEMMRRTQNYLKGIEILDAPGNYKKYPDLHVRRLGRLAALYGEGDYFEETFSDDVNVVDSIQQFLSEALQIAIANDFLEQEAGLQNELGLFIMRQNSRKASIPHLERSAEIFLELGDTVNYIRPMIFLMENELEFGNLNRFDKIANDLLALVNGNNWYNVEADLFKMIGNRYLSVGDSLNHCQWQMKADKNHLEVQKIINNDRMISYEVLYETEKFQREAFEAKIFALEKSQDLDKERLKNQNLYLLLALLLIIILAFGLIYFRERSLKKALAKTNQDLHLSNEKYQLLMVESNHRIKNNLQMVISMFDYSDENMSVEQQKINQKISAKIHTISSLHNHLTLEKHNELVDLGVYLFDILALYDSLDNHFKLVTSFESIQIRSEKIVYFGLILNEMLSNTLEHHNGSKKEIQISLLPNNGAWVFRYCDHSKMDNNHSTGTGTELIQQLITRVGGTDLVFKKSIGLYQFSFHA